MNKPLNEASGSSKLTINSIKLTNEQRKKIEQNRVRALNKLKEKQANFRNASGSTNPSLAAATSPSKAPGATQSIRPSIQKHTYIDYDLATMKDSRGGFIAAEEGGSGQPSDGKTFEEWQEEQKIHRDMPPPLDMESATKCYECGTFDIDTQLWEVFKCRVCKRCARAKPEKYSLLTKTECREDYFLTGPELDDLTLLARLEKPNPHGTFSRMQLFLRYQVEEFAFKKWGGAEGLDAEWQRREETKIRRRDKKYELRMKEMRKKTRAEEYNRRIREGRFDSEHRHHFSSNVVDGQVNEDGLRTVRRRCIDCGFETEEIVM